MWVRGPHKFNPALASSNLEALLMSSNEVQAIIEENLCNVALDGVVIWPAELVSGHDVDFSFFDLDHVADAYKLYGVSCYTKEPFDVVVLDHLLVVLSFDAFYFVDD